MDSTKRFIRRKKRCPPRRKEQALQRIDALRAQGMTIDEAIVEADISRASFFRWMREAQRTTRLIGAVDEEALAAENLLVVSSAIAALARNAPLSRPDRLLAVARFACWLQKPKLDYEYRLAVLSYYSAYLRQRDGNKLLSDLQEGDKAAIISMIDLRFLENLTSPTISSSAPLEDYSIYDQPFTERDAVAHVAWCLLCTVPDKKGVEHPISLMKAHYLLACGGFEYRWPVHKSGFQASWREFGAASAFLYVERMHSNLDWNLDPHSLGFVEAVDDLMNDEEGVREYFARCKHALHRMLALHPQLRRHLKPPEMPPGLATEDVPPPPLTSQITTALSQFTANYVIDYDW